ncbi:hypothetical protein [uncultured Alsobacter sp.]|uniref:hypothetical protein n=1 Tax=uncultured Alsobacter sp. TaxID=1748258 RepID=UPI0025DA9B85|nr:hypothetical protein [uncultured Alsobacter sp.]
MSEPVPTRGPGSRVVHWLLAPIRVIVAVIVVLDELARPIYRPVAAWFASLRLVRRAEALVATLPPYAVLGILAVPLIGVEPLKVLALIWLSQGRLVAGVVLMGIAYAGSFLLVERIYDAGHAQLMKIRWVAVIMTAVTRIRQAVLQWVRGTAVWAAAMAAVARVKAWRLSIVQALRALRSPSS